MKGPGLKPLFIRGRIRGPEGPRSLRPVHVLLQRLSASSFAIFCRNVGNRFPSLTAPKAVDRTAGGSQQVEDGLDGNGLGLGHFDKNCVKCADLERVVHRNGDRMDGRRLVKEPDMASLLANHGVAEPFQSADQPVGRYPRGSFMQPRLASIHP